MPCEFALKIANMLNCGSLFLRWINLKAIKRLVDTGALKLDDLSTLKVLFV